MKPNLDSTFVLHSYFGEGHIVQISKLCKYCHHKTLGDSHWSRARIKSFAHFPKYCWYLVSMFMLLWNEDVIDIPWRILDWKHSWTFYFLTDLLSSFVSEVCKGLKPYFIYLFIRFMYRFFFEICFRMIYL